MKLKFLSYVLIFGLAWVLSCSSIDITPNPINADTNLNNTVTIPSLVMENMEGIYKLTDGNGSLGSQFVCKVSRYRVSFFSDKDGIMIILKYGRNPVDNSIQFSGFWRYSQTSEQGLINLSVASGDGASDLIQNGNATKLKIQGIFGGAKPITISYSKPFSIYTQTNEFIIFGHHGIQTASNPPYTENSLKAAFHAQEYGLTGIEYDVRLTRDNVPICIHDPGVNIRLTKKGPLAGNFDQYNFQLLRNNIELIDGQKIPSVEEVLKVVVDSTYLKFVWLDIKGNPGVFGYLEPVVRAAIASAAAQGRVLTIFAGLPSDDVISELKAQPSYSSLPLLCELSIDCAIENNAQFFGPRYSEGLLLDEVDRAHANGIKVISWTLNDKNIIHNYMHNGRFDGFITDYPAFVVYDYYTMN